MQPERTRWSSRQLALPAALLGLVVAVVLGSRATTTADGAAVVAPGRPTLFEFHMPGCAACVRVEQAVASLRRDCGGGLSLRQLDVTREENRTLVERLGVEVVPTFVGLDAEGREQVRFVGEQSLDRLRAAAALLTGERCAGVEARHAFAEPAETRPACPDPTSRPDETPRTCGG